MIYGSLLLAGGVLAATTLLKNQSQVAEAADGTKQIEIPFATALGEGEMRSLKVGDAND